MCKRMGFYLTFPTPSPPLPTTRVDSFRHVLPKRLAHTSRRRHCFLWRTPSPVKLGLHIRWAASMSSCSHLTKHPFASIWNTSFRSYQRLLFSTAIRRDRALAEKNQGTKSNRGLWIAPAHSFEAVLAPALATQMLAPSNALPAGVEFWLRD